MDPLTISMLFNAGASAYQIYKSNADMKKAAQAAQAFGAELKNTREADRVSGLQVPTLGTDLAMGAVGQQVASGMNVLSGAGAAGVIGGVPGLVAAGGAANLDIAAQLDENQARRDQFVAAQLQGIEQRDVNARRGFIEDQLMGAHSMLAEGRQAQRAGIQGLLKNLGGAAGEELRAQHLLAGIDNPNRPL